MMLAVDAQNQPALSAQSLRKRYGVRQVLHDISLLIERAQITGLLGPNGAGKTTTFYILAGLIRADHGTICLGDQDLTHWRMHQRAKAGLTYLPQESSIFRKLNVSDNIRAVLELQKDAQGNAYRTAQIETKLAELLSDLQIEHIAYSDAVALSGGERRRVEVARALACNPKFLLLDEPFAGIDPIAVMDIQHIMHLLKSRGIGILITDHNVRETLRICDHAYIVSDGRVLDAGDPKKIVLNPEVKRAYLGDHFHF